MKRLHAKKSAEMYTAQPDAYSVAPVAEGADSGASQAVKAQLQLRELILAGELPGGSRIAELAIVEQAGRLAHADPRGPDAARTGGAAAGAAGWRLCGTDLFRARCVGRHRTARHAGRHGRPAGRRARCAARAAAAGARLSRRGGRGARPAGARRPRLPALRHAQPVVSQPAARHGRQRGDRARTRTRCQTSVRIAVRFCGGAGQFGAGARHARASPRTSIARCWTRSRSARARGPKPSCASTRGWRGATCGRRCRTRTWPTCPGCACCAPARAGAMVESSGLK